MFLFDFILAILISFVVLAGFAMFGSKGPWDNLGTLFVVVLLITWAGGAWLTPVGPTLYGETWVPHLIVAGLVALLLVNLVPHRDVELLTSPEKKLEENEPRGVAIIATLGIAFWIFVCALIVSIGLAYIV